MLDRRRPRYRAYLLRCWESGTDDCASGSGWRFSLEDPHTGQRRNFAGIDALLAALQADLIDDSPEDDSSRDTERNGRG